ncbi:uncharacterized protein LOC124337704 [Daphnia pulicaria]|uniref:uncharacterized protein LOC124337704 n=1 Tax=Daphnia pulicaria TaxID=35523 RepID=UPI001EEA8B6C|nr:uncharacterized protein LOC124337704 [Daphnia pulicaria]
MPAVLSHVRHTLEKEPLSSDYSISVNHSLLLVRNILNASERSTQMADIVFDIGERQDQQQDQLVRILLTQGLDRLLISLLACAHKERFWIKSLPELHFVEEIKDWEPLGTPTPRGKVVPLKQTAKTLTLHLHNGQFVKRGGTFFWFFYGNFHGSEFKNCVVRSAIQKEVRKVFPNADAEFDMNVQLWFDNQPSSSVVRNTEAQRAF